MKNLLKNTFVVLFVLGLLAFISMVTTSDVKADPIATNTPWTLNNIPTSYPVVTPPQPTKVGFPTPAVNPYPEPEETVEPYPVPEQKVPFTIPRPIRGGRSK
jgi:hypothetical protein